MYQPVAPFPKCKYRTCKCGGSVHILICASCQRASFWKRRTFVRGQKGAVCFGRRDRLTGGRWFCPSGRLTGVMKRFLKDIKGQPAAPSARHFQGIVRIFLGGGGEMMK